MSRIFRLFICLSLATALLSAPAVVASPADEASTPWWSSLARLWSHIFTPLSSGESTNIGPDIDPDGITATTDSEDDGGNMGPDIDPNGLTVLPTDGAGANRGPDSHPDGLTAGAVSDGNRGPDIDPNG